MQSTQITTLVDHHHQQQQQMQRQQNRIATATTTIYSILDHSTPIYALMQAWPGLETE